MNRTDKIYASLAPLILVLEVLFFVNQQDVVLLAYTDTNLGMAIGATLAVSLLTLLVLSTAVFITNRKKPRDMVGRTRLLIGSFAGMLHALIWIVVIGIILSQGFSYIMRTSLGIGYPVHFQWMRLPGFILGIGSGLLLLGSSIACWFLLDLRIRERIWALLDTTLFISVIAAFILLPSQPDQGEPNNLILPITRHIITTVAILRLIARLLPRCLDLIERIGFRPLIAARHLRTNKSGFLAAISILSVMAVTVSSCALTTTLSVMGGFRSDLKRKILGNNAHIVIDRDHLTVHDWKPIVTDAEQTQGVIGVSPYVSGEVMLSSSSNLATAILRGIDPESIGKVSDLPKNLRSGDLNYLKHPEELLKLPDDLFQGVLLPLKSKPIGKSDSNQKSKKAKSTDNGLDAVDEEKLALLEKGKTEPSASPSEKVKASIAKTHQESTKKKRTDIDEFLIKEDKALATKRKVLPGIIIGQELAKALRLYVGDEVNVVSPLGALGPTGPMPKSKPYRVAGIFFSGMYEYDMKHAYIEISTAQKFLNTDDAISGVEVKVADVEKSPQITARLRETLRNRELRIRDWKELNSRLFGALALEKLVMFLVLGIAILVASFCIAGTLTLMVQEKGREVAIMKAMGTADRSIIGVFMIEGGLIGILGATLGLFLGYMVCFGAEHFGIRMDPEVYYIDRLPVHIDGIEFSLVGISAIAICLLVTIYPALLASRLRPIEALRYE